jgi:methylene-tetrahydromethanopterin dehydrogenase
VTLVGYDGPARVKGLAETAKERFQVDLQSADGSTDALKAVLLKDAEVVLCAGRAGVQILSALQISESKTLKVAADINAVPPSASRASARRTMASKWGPVSASGRLPSAA